MDQNSKWSGKLILTATTLIAFSFQVPLSSLKLEQHSVVSALWCTSPYMWHLSLVLMFCKRQHHRCSSDHAEVSDAVCVWNPAQPTPCSPPFCRKRSASSQVLSRSRFLKDLCCAYSYKWKVSPIIWLINSSLLDCHPASAWISQKSLKCSSWVNTEMMP